MKERVMHIFLTVALAVVMVLIAFDSTPLLALSVEEISVIKIAPFDETAVIKIPDKKLQVIKKGYLLEGIGTVVEITKERVVIEQTTKRGKELVIIRIKGKKQLIERIRKTDEEPGLFLIPQDVQEAK